MSRFVVTTPVTLAGSGYNAPPRTLHKGEVVELSAAEVTALGAGNMRTASAAVVHDQLGEAFAASNSS